MLFWIFVAFMIAGFIWCKFDDCSFLALLMTVVGGGLVLISVIIMLVNYIDIDGYIARMNIRYDMLVYQLENDVYENDNDLGKRELMVNIQDWNEDLVHNQSAQDDFWVGIYIPNIYDQFELISLEGENDGRS